MNHPVSEMLTNSMAKIREMVDVNTVVGDPIVTEQGITLIPISKVSCGYAGGGSDFVTKNTTTTNPFGGGSGCSVKITPMAFLVVKGENVRMLPVTEQPASSVDRLLDLLPEIADKVSELIRKKSAEKDTEVIR